MNNRSSVNETSLVNFPADLTSINPLDTKEPLLSFPFDHIYACHSETSDRRQTLQLDKEVEISHCVVTEDKDLTERLVSLEKQNKKLKDLLIYHLDLIQQQNDLITKREKVYQALKQENDALKTKVRADKRVATPTRPQSLNPPPLVQLPSATVTSAVKSDLPSSSTQSYFNTFSEILLPDITVPSSYLYNTDFTTTNNKKDTFEYRSTDPVTDRSNYLTPVEVSVPTILESSSIATDSFNMIEHRRAKKQDTKISESPAEPRYTVTTNSGTPVIHRIPRNKRKSTGIGSLSRMPKTQKTEAIDANKIYEDDKMFSVNKKSKMINTYSKQSKLKYPFTGSLSDRLQLIDTTPTGEDPYQIGEAEMREQSPIPKLMLQKTNHGRIKICSDGVGGVTSTTTPTTSSRRVYDTMTDTNGKKTRGTRNPRSQPKKAAATLPAQLQMDIVKPEPEVEDWQMGFSYSPPNRTVRETSLCDFSYGETSANLATDISLDMGLPDFFEPSSVNADLLGPEMLVLTSDKSAEKTKKRGTRTTSLAGLMGEDGNVDVKRGTDSKRGRKRAFSAASTTKREKAPAGPTKPKLMKSRATPRAKKIPLPGVTTLKPYFTMMGDPDVSWYLGLDPDVKRDDVDQISEIKASEVEVPRWREKPYTSLYSLEGTENLHDRVFEKRHHKLEAEERRQLRWHMRRVREQRHVERLRLRQRDPWGPSSTQLLPTDYTIWPQPLRDLQFIEITETLPVLAFGEDMPAVPENDFVLSWVRTSKAQKRSKRSKTLH